MASLLFVISAASGTGKTSLVKALVANTPNLFVCVSHTTRAPREGEVHGQHYHFTTQDEFNALVKVGEFIEHAEVFSNYYGTSRQVVQSMLAQGKDVILEIDWQGALAIKKEYPPAILIFIVPPSRKELQARLKTRDTDSLEEIERRLEGSIEEISKYHDFNYMVLNDEFNKALKDLESIVRCNRLTTGQQELKLQDVLDDLIRENPDPEEKPDTNKKDSDHH